MLVLPDTFDVCLAKQKLLLAAITLFQMFIVLKFINLLGQLIDFTLLSWKWYFEQSIKVPVLENEVGLACPGFFHHCQGSFGADRLWREEHPGETIEVLHGVGGALETPLAQDNDWDVIPEQISFFCVTYRF